MRTSRASFTSPPRRSVVYQDSRLLPWTKVLDNVVLGLPRADAALRGRTALAEVGLSGHENDWPKTLSGGEAQRVSLARALVRQPDLLLLDEPFGALDALTRIRMHTLVVQLCERHHPAVLFVTHDVDEAILLADRVLVLSDGQLSLDLAVDVERPRLRGNPMFSRAFDPVSSPSSVSTRPVRARRRSDPDESPRPFPQKERLI